MTTSERDFQSTETLDEALRTPWALHYEIQRRAATPNFSCNSTQGKLIKTSVDSCRERRLKQIVLQFFLTDEIQLTTCRLLSTNHSLEVFHRE